MTGGITENKQYLKHCERFNLSTEKWEKIADMTVPRAGHFMWTDEQGKILYAAGGVSAENGNPLNTIEKFNPSGGRWETISGKT